MNKIKVAVIAENEAAGKEIADRLGVDDTREFIVATNLEDITEEFEEKRESPRAFLNKHYLEMKMKFDDIQYKKGKPRPVKIMTLQELPEAITKKMTALMEEGVEPEVLFVSEHQYFNLVKVAKEQYPETVYRKESGDYRIRSYKGLRVYKLSIDKKLVVKEDINHIEVLGSKRIKSKKK